MVEEKALGNEARARKQQVGGGTWRHPIPLSAPCLGPALAMATTGVTAGRSRGRRRERETPRRKAQPAAGAGPVEGEQSRENSQLRDGHSQSQAEVEKVWVHKWRPFMAKNQVLSKSSVS